MFIKKYKLLFLITFLLNCSSLFNEGYQGLATTTLAGHIVFSASACYIATDVSDEESEVIFNMVINLVTLGDKYVTACVTNDNYDNMLDTINTFDEPLKSAILALVNSASVSFYASDTVIAPGSSTVGGASEILLYGTAPTNNLTSSFSLGVLSNTLNLQKCSELDSSFLGYNFSELDLSILHKKPYIVARIPICGNLPLGTASNPLYSEKNYLKE